MAETDVWDTIARKIVPAIVNIQVALPYSFDTAESGGGRATGFVVDKSLGLICTNAHVITGAPLSARATFFERESFEPGAADVNLSTFYTDPVHDFAFVRYNTEDLKADDIEPAQLSFAQEVKVFQDICIMGNDAGQVISLLPGIVSRVNRNPPSLWHLFNDSSEYHRKFKNSYDNLFASDPLSPRIGRYLRR
jgi:S1-C subfamily serine protease